MYLLNFGEGGGKDFIVRKQISWWERQLLISAKGSSAVGGRVVEVRHDPVNWKLMGMRDAQ